MSNDFPHSCPALSVQFIPPIISARIDIPENVENFFTQAAALLGNIAKIDFEEEISQGCRDIQIESPIEQLLLCALSVFAHPSLALKYCESEGHKILITPQKRIGRYRVDFEVQYYRVDNRSNALRSVLVECDSQTFHDRTERERRAEKIRDRFLQMSGHKVLHFTGTEIFTNPFFVAAEVIAYLVNEKPENVYEWYEIYRHAE